MSVEFETSVAGIWKKPGMCGGSACIHGHRIPVWLLVAMRHDGASDANLLENYPSLRADDLAAAWSYYERFPNEIEQEIRENEEDQEPAE